jgi:hypothetical protein
MNDNKTPHDQDGQQPTHNAKETEERLEEKEHEDTVRRTRTASKRRSRR